MNSQELTAAESIRTVYQKLHKGPVTQRIFHTDQEYVISRLIKAFPKFHVRKTGTYSVYVVITVSRVYSGLEIADNLCQDLFAHFYVNYFHKYTQKIQASDIEKLVGYLDDSFPHLYYKYMHVQNGEFELIISLTDPFENTNLLKDTECLSSGDSYQSHIDKLEKRQLEELKRITSIDQESEFVFQVAIDEWKFGVITNENIQEMAKYGYIISTNSLGDRVKLMWSKPK